MNARTPSRGFSLVEVVIAIGIFAASVAVILGLLPTLTRQAADATEVRVAQSLPDAVKVEMERIGFDALAGAVPVMGTPLENGYRFVAVRDGSRLHAVAPLPVSSPVIPQAQRFFLVEAWRFSQAPLAYDPAGAVLPVYVRVSWPYYNPGSTTPTPVEGRAQFTFTVAINR